MVTSTDAYHCFILLFVFLRFLFFSSLQEEKLQSVQLMALRNSTKSLGYSQSMITAVTWKDKKKSLQEFYGQTDKLVLVNNQY